MDSLGLFAGIDWSTADAAINAARRIGERSSLDTSTAYIALAEVMFNFGNDCKMRQMTALPSVLPLFNAFDAAYRAQGSGRQALKPKVAEGLVSSFKAWAEAGIFRPYNAEAIARYAAEKVGGAYSKRGAYLRDMLKAFPTVPPTAEQLAAGNVKKEATLNTKAMAMLAVVDQIEKEAALLAATKADTSVRVAYLDAVASIKAFQKLTAEHDDSGDAAIDAERTKLRAELAAA
jgi:hypothetical protein